MLEHSSLIFPKYLKNLRLAAQNPWGFGPMDPHFLRLFSGLTPPHRIEHPRQWGLMHWYKFFLPIHTNIDVKSSDTQILSQESSCLQISNLLPNVPSMFRDWTPSSLPCYQTCPTCWKIRVSGPCRRCCRHLGPDVSLILHPTQTQSAPSGREI